MSEKLNIEELKTLIANSIREENLHEALPEDAVERIKNKILGVRDRESSNQIPDVVSEAETPTLQFNSNTNMFPDEDKVSDAIEATQEEPVVEPQGVQLDSGSYQSELPSNPTVGYTPELPEVLKKAEPAELFIFQQSDLNKSGENLSNKPLRLMDDPDVMKSMSDLWMQEGKTRAKVYAAKFEEIGEITFDYTTGVSKFTEKSSLPDFQGGSEYKENPYEAGSVPQIDASKQQELETYIKSSIDLEKVVKDIVMGIMKDSLLTNTEKAVSEDIYKSSDNSGIGINPTQLVRPMEESFSITMKDMVEDDKFKKVTIPSELIESIDSGDKSKLISENEQIQKWSFEGEDYYLPIGRITKNKGYIKS